MKKISNYLLLLYSFILFTFIYYVVVTFLNKKENFTNTNNNQPIVLLGDSILNNRSYVSQNNSLEDLLKQETNVSIYNYAQDDSTINDVYKQLNSIPENIIQHSNTVFLSVGGNDIINYYILQKKNPEDLQFVERKFQEYTKLVEAIQKKMVPSKIILLDLYYPYHSFFQNYYPVITYWNKLLNSVRNNFTIITTSNMVNQPDDFANSIEPNENGGMKIVNLMKKYL
jgi:hypothetical protein